MRVLLLLGLTCLLFLTGCTRRPNQPARNSTNEPVVPAGSPAGAPAGTTLADARRGFQTRLLPDPSPREEVEAPDRSIFQLVKYDSAVGTLPAYLSVSPSDGKRRPAIIWITGGDCNSIGDVWSAQPNTNDQSAAAYRHHDVVMMFPSLRGGNRNPGRKEGFLGEVDDVIAAADYLAKLDDVDPDRIYLGGHSTGGTLVMLVAEMTNRFRAVFSFGPVDDVSGYPREFTPFDTTNPREVALRSPGRWLSSIKSPTFVFEGTSDGNVGALQAMQRSNSNPNIFFFPIEGADHFSVLAPINGLIAQKIKAESQGEPSRFSLTVREVHDVFPRLRGR